MGYGINNLKALYRVAAIVSLGAGIALSIAIGNAPVMAAFFAVAVMTSIAEVVGNGSALRSTQSADVLAAQVVDARLATASTVDVRNSRVAEWIAPAAARTRANLAETLCGQGLGTFCQHFPEHPLGRRAAPR